jgi:hypothetical protein
MAVIDADIVMVVELGNWTVVLSGELVGLGIMELELNGSMYGVVEVAKPIAEIVDM